MLDRLVEFVAHWDWFVYVGELGRWLMGVRSWRFAVSRDCETSGKDIEALLRRHGVQLWGRNFDRRHLFFRVKLQQANWAEYLLWRNGIAVSSPPFNKRNRLATAPSQNAPAKRAAASGSQDWWDSIARFLGI